MKNALMKDSLKEIKNTHKRFLSILLMAFLGVGFFAGIQATSPDMVNTINKYYKDQQVYDIQIMSTLGLKDSDIQEVSKINGVEKAIGTYETDGKIEIGEKEIVAKVLCLEDMNTPKLLEGRLPQSIDECLVEENFLTFNNKKIGDTIELNIAKSKNDDGEEIDYLKQNKLKIVGTVQSPVYISKDRGNSKLGAGKVNYYMYIDKENINAKDIYTNLYVKVKDADKYTTSKNQYKETVQNVKNEIDQIKSSREQARKDELVEIATKKVDDAEKELNSQKEEANKQIEDAKKQLKDAKNKIPQSELAKIELKKQEVNKQLQEAEGKVADSRDQISKIEKPTWYILDRESNSGYVSFIQDSKSIENIGKVFPAVFFIVATLISLTSMTRMVEEERTQIGTLKALGYNKIQIASKYIIYASLACIIGGVLGMCIGFVILPTIIWKMYMMMYQMTDVVLEFNWLYGGIGLGLILVCIVGTTIYSIQKELQETPATLMRPKAPKMGKRVLLEKIPFIWKRLSFSRKVTVRNIFRYKKRVLMTIIGIMGCTSLILAGFGLKDSISAIMPSQYGKIFNYDMQINLKDGLTDEQIKSYMEKLAKRDDVVKVAETYLTSTTVENGSLDEDAQIIVPKENEGLKDLITIYDKKTKQPINLNSDEICLTDKAAQLLNVSVGDTVKLKDSDGNVVEAKIGNIVENYINHYVYMSKELYQKIYKTDYKINAILLKDNNLSVEQVENLSKEFMKENEVSSVSAMSTLTEMINNMLNSLNFVVVVLIVTAGMLAFVVLYNLSNVNISERIRELATIKVLGFYDKEVYDYISRETVILTIIGILLGLVGGYFLNYFIITTCEINMLRFVKVIHPISYIYSICITVGFTLMVNIVTYFALKKIDMIESLKSVE